VWTRYIEDFNSPGRQSLIQSSIKGSLPGLAFMDLVLPHRSWCYSTVAAWNSGCFHTAAALKTRALLQKALLALRMKLGGEQMRGVSSKSAVSKTTYMWKMHVQRSWNMIYNIIHRF
jgi:hypothetical protein